MLLRVHACVFCLSLLLPRAHAQPIPVHFPEPFPVCPGAFPTDLTKTDCSYTLSKRTLAFVTGSVTDQAVLGAVVFGTGAQIIQSPPEWKRTWYGYDHRVGARYTQALGKGAAQYLAGLILNDDPRFLAYRAEPSLIKRRQENTQDLQEHRSAARESPLEHDGWQRFGHAWLDAVTVRLSSAGGDGRRIPAISRFAGEFAGAYAGYPWYPGPENKFPQVCQRAGGAFGTAVLSSFWNEYHPEMTNLLGAVFHRSSQPLQNTGGTR